MLKFNIFGIPVQVHPMFWVFMLLFVTLFTGGDATATTIILKVLAFFLSILIHELGHALMARRYGAPVRIDLHGIGGRASYILPNPTKKKTIIITAAGPVLQLVVGLVALYILAPLSQGTLAAAFIAPFVWISLILAVFNLIPVYPMDGGQILYEALPYNKRHIAFRVGIVISVLGVLIGLSIGQFFLAIFAGLGAWGCYQRLKQG